VSTETLLRSTTHPPCPQEQEILEIAVPADRTELSITDRLSLRLGLWLMLRTQRRRGSRSTPMSRDEALRLLNARRTAQVERFTERETLTMLTYDMQRHML
jgi:hypothetical protein